MQETARPSVLGDLARVAGRVPTVRDLLQARIEPCFADALRSDDEGDRRGESGEMMTVVERQGQFRGR